MDGGMDSDSDDSRGEEISLAEARPPYQITMVNNSDMMKLEGKQNNGAKFSRYLRVIFPHILLLLVNFVLVFAIAIVYYFVEGQNEKMERVKLEMNVEIVQRNFMAQLHNLAPMFPIEKLHRETEEFGREMMRMGWTKGRLGVPVSGMVPPNAITNNNNNNADDANGQQQEPIVWTWANSLLFAFSLITRIGYGHLFPLTVFGKTLLVPFAIIGVPFFLVAIADVGKIISDGIKAIYKMLWRFYRNCRRAIKKRRQKPPPSGGSVNRNNQNASIKSKSQDRKTPQQEAAEEKSTPGGVSLNMNDYSTAEELDEDEYLEHLRIPLKLILLLFVLFWALMALFYRHIEEWAWLDCFYFTFVSFSIIGFGDFAPSTAFSAVSTICLLVPMLSFIGLLIDLGGTELMRKMHFITIIFQNIPKTVKAKFRRRKKRKRPARKN